MKAIEREIARHLYEAASAAGFRCFRFACTPATGEPDDEIADPTFDACMEHAKAWDSNSVIEFKHADGRAFWALLVWGNDEDLISDYTYKPYAESIIDTVNSWIEGATGYRALER